MIHNMMVHLVLSDNITSTIYIPIGPVSDSQIKSLDVTGAPICKVITNYDHFSSMVLEGGKCNLRLIEGNV